MQHRPCSRSGLHVALWVWALCTACGARQNPLPVLSPPALLSQKSAPMRSEPVDDGEMLRWDRANTALLDDIG